MKRTALFSSEEKTRPILIVDRVGVFGKALAREFSKEILTVFVTGKKNIEGLNLQNTIHIFYRKKFPNIPNNTYSHIILFDDKDLSSKDLLPEFSKKSSHDKSSLFYITYLTERSLKSARKINEVYKNTKVIVYGDVFGDGDAFKFDNLVNSILRQVVEDKKIKIPGDGLIQIYPVLFKEAVRGIFKAIIAGGNSRLFYLFSKNPETLISFSHAIQKIDPFVAVDFVKKKKKQREIKIEEKGEYLIDEEERIGEKIKKINLNEKSDILPEASHKGINRFYNKKNFNIPYLVFFLFFLFLLPSLFTIFFVGLGFFQARSVVSDIENGNVSDPFKKISQGELLLSFGAHAGKIAKLQLSVVGLGSKASEALLVVDDYRHLLKGGKEATSAVFSMKKVFDGKTVFPEETILGSIASYKKSLNILEELRINKKLNKDIIEKTEKYISVINIAYGINDSIYSVINPSGSMKYLILFQNNMELRPGGGFIGSYGILDLNRGKISNFSIHDVYEADGQLKGHVEPPYPIRRYLPSAHLYLRDSNFDIEFTKSASSAALLLFQETGQRVDGIIGIDVSFVRELIGSFGEITVPEYSQKINRDNFYSITQSHVEKDFFPSSTQKKDFLNSLFKELRNKLIEDSGYAYDKIAIAISRAIMEKHIVFAFLDNNTQGVFTANKWSSNINDNREVKGNAVNDFFGINEANLGVNKANYFISRNMKYDVEIKNDGLVTSRATLTLKNDSNKWPGGDYKVYLRIIVPKNSVVSSIEIDGVAQRRVQAITNPLLYERRAFKPPNGLEVERYDQNGKTVYGFLAIVSAGKSKEIVVDYIHSKKVSPASPQLTYSLNVFKQPGTDEFPFNFSLSYPKEYFPLALLSKAILQEGRIAVSKILLGDESISVDLSRK